MGYEVKMPEVIAMRKAVMAAAAAYMDELEKVVPAVKGITESDGFEGETADAVSLYVNEVHGTLVGVLGQAVSELADRAMVYESGFTEIDGSDDAHITQESLEEVQTRVEGNMGDFAEEVGNLSDVLYSVSDLFASPIPPIENVSNNYDAIRETTTNLNQSTGSYEASHMGDCANINGMLESVLSIIDAQNSGTISVNNYSAGKIANLDAFKTLQESYKASVQYYSNNTQQIADAHDNIASKIEAEIAAAEKAAAEERARKGFWDAAAAIGTMAIGAAAIICTGGAATPLVVAAGVSAMAYGASNLGEAGQDIYYGLKGDSKTASFNLLRDTVFMGNQTVYDIWGTASTAMSLGFAFAGAGAQAAVASGEANPFTIGNMSRSVGTGIKTFVTGGVKNAAVTVAKVGLVGEAGNLVNKALTPYTSEDFGRLVGVITSTFAARKLFGNNETSPDKKMEDGGGVKTSDDKALVERPNWRASEMHAEQTYSDFSSQKSFKIVDGELKEVPYGTKGSIRPDLISLEEDGAEIIKVNEIIEVKNYNVETSQGRNNLARNIIQQAKSRSNVFPEGTKQTYFVDIKGQNIDYIQLDKMIQRIYAETGNGVEVLLMKW